jgi:hypothetical protein
MYLANENDDGWSHPNQNFFDPVVRERKVVDTYRRCVILWRLTLSKKLGQPNFGIITTVIYIGQCRSVLQSAVLRRKGLRQSTA